ncbi:MAG: DNA methyltransferase [Pseudomonadota bacterium]
MRPYLSANRKKGKVKILNGDACDFFESLEPNSVDLIVTSPPYFMGKEYDRSSSPEDFIEEHRKIFPLAVRALKKGGSLCWQVGNHVRKGKLIPLDALVYAASIATPKLILRNRIVWSFGHGVHCVNRFSGRHETIMWFTKGDQYHFNLDSVRVPQRYPGKRHYKGPKKGEFSGNPLGKNPGDVWDIPNVKAKHKEKTEHPCQFPVALVQRLIRSLCPANGVVADPYLGSGSSAIASLLEQREFVGCEIESRYLRIARGRVEDFFSGQLCVRPDVPTRVPIPGEAVSLRPSHFATLTELRQ